ncbi:acyltransferase [Congregibacter brevis]|uniref:Acyltransferase n=1 Tax=Congregibacter brevis TaxID=3081201 RepID=A0ABZ0IJQ1_9GAMM|nr:acyltransferase [Congregibacter sp. IMCC45268]
MNKLINETDRRYLDALRGLSILRVMLGHLGLLWFYPPHSWYLGALFPILFFVSGAVSYNSFLRTKDIWRYALQRYIAIAVPFYTFMVLLICVLYASNKSLLVLDDGPLRWAFMWPRWGLIEIPIGQIWFINALFIMSAISILIFPLFRRFKHATIGTVSTLFAINLVGDFLPVRETFIASTEPVLGGYATQAWVIATLITFYFFGALFYSFGISDMHIKKMLSLIAVSGIAVIIVYPESPFFPPHVEIKSAYFVFVSLLATLSVLALKPAYFALTRRVNIVERLFLYASKHSYAIFLLHTVVLYYIESAFNWHDLSQNTGLAIARLLLVSAITLLLAPLFTSLTNQIVKGLKAIIATTV